MQPFILVPGKQVEAGARTWCLCNISEWSLVSKDTRVQPFIVIPGKGGRHQKSPKFEHIFVAVITFSPFFCANTFDTSLLLIVCALR